MAQWTPPSEIPLVQRPPTRLVASGTFTLLANSSTRQDTNAAAYFAGGNNRQERIQIIITNLDAALYIKWQTGNGLNAGSIFAQLPWTIETSADILLYNPNGSNVQVEVCELYPDTGNLHGIPGPLAARIAGTAGGGGTSGGSSGAGGSGSGGAAGGGSTFSGGGYSGFGGRSAAPP